MYIAKKYILSLLKMINFFIDIGRAKWYNISVKKVLPMAIKLLTGHMNYLFYHLRRGTKEANRLKNQDQYMKMRIHLENYMP